jgi:hypothetical protein
LRMSQCTKILDTGDPKVKDGTRKEGERCTGMYASEKTHGLCGGHYRAWCSKNEPETNRVHTEKQKQTMLAHNRKVKEKHTEIIENSEAELSKDAKEILPAMKKTEPYDLVKEYALLRQLNVRPEIENYTEKFAFALWLKTPESYRTPETMEEVAGILGFSVLTLSLWRRSPELTKIFNMNARESALSCYPLVWERLMEAVNRGSERAMDLALKHLKELESAKAEKSTFPKLSQELVDEAKTITADGNTGMLRGVANAVNKTAQLNNLLNGDIKPNETVQ